MLKMKVLTILIHASDSEKMKGQYLTKLHLHSGKKQFVVSSCCLLKVFCFFRGPKGRKKQTKMRLISTSIYIPFVELLPDTNRSLTVSSLILGVFHLVYWNLRIIRGVTCTCTNNWCCPTKHRYQPVSFICSFFRVTAKDPVLSSLTATEESSYLPSGPVTTQELQSPERHNFFSVSLSTDVTKESVKDDCPNKFSRKFSSLVWAPWRTWSLMSEGDLEMKMMIIKYLYLSL